MASYGALVASDNEADAAYSANWLSGSNGGTGFNAWALIATGTAGFFTGDSSLNAGGTSGNINTSGKSWGAFANTGGLASAVRTFQAGGPNAASTLAIGQQFVTSFDNGFINSGGTVGFGLQDSAGGNRFEFFFAGGAAGYTVSDSAPVTTAHGFTGDGLRATFTLTGTDKYSFGLSYNTGAPASESFSGTLKGTAGNGIDRFRFFNSNAGTTSNNDAFINSVAIVPEPGSMILFSVAAIGLLTARRRKA